MMVLVIVMKLQFVCDNCGARKWIEDPIKTSFPCEFCGAGTMRMTTIQPKLQSSQK